MGTLNRKIARRYGKAIDLDNFKADGSLATGAPEIYDSAGLLPTSGVAVGTQAYVTANQKLYIRATGGWYNVATVNTTPTISSVADASSNTSPFDLAKDGSTTTVITITATDSEGFPLTFSAVANSGFNGLATVAQDSSVFTITPKSQAAATTTSGTLTFRASDGVNIASEIATFVLNFAAIVDQTSTYTTPLSNATNANWPSSSYSATSSYSSSDYSWTLGTISQNFGGFRKVIDWDVDNQSEMLFVVAVTGAGTTFNSRSGQEIGFQSSDFSKNVGFYRASYNPDNNNYLFTRQDVASGLTIGGSSGSGFLAISENSNTIASWYMAMRINLSTGAAKGWISEDSGSTWTQSASGTYANPGDLTHAYIAMNRRTGTGNKIALLDASNYSSTLTL